MEKDELKLLSKFLQNLSDAVLPKMSNGMGKTYFNTGLSELKAAKLVGWETEKLKTARENFDKAASYLPEEQQVEAYKNACICVMLQGDAELRKAYYTKIKTLTLSEKRKKYIEKNEWDFSGFVTLFRVIWSLITGKKYVSGHDRLILAMVELKRQQGQALVQLDEFEQLLSKGR